MLLKIDKEFFFKKGYKISFDQRGKEFLYKAYVGVSIYNKKNEVVDFVDVIIKLTKTKDRYKLSSCISNDNKKVNYKSKLFRTENIKEILEFDLNNPFSI